MAGREIAAYRIEAEIGRGGMATVYRARDLRLDRTVALKLLSPGLARNEVFRERFIRESRLAAGLDHPHIVPVFEAGEADGVLYIAMRYVPGEDLRALLDRQGRLSVDTTARIAAQVASALDAAHAHGLVHRDVKPGNILVAEGIDPDHPEHVYLADFGLMKRSLSLTGLTSTGQFVGTVDYVAPEQISGRPVDGRCDVYSLACVVYEALAGTPPFRRDDDLAQLWAHLNEPAPPLSSHRTDLPAGVDAVLAKGLAKSPDDRYGSCLAFVAALRDAGGGLGKRAAPHPATQVDHGPAVPAAQPPRPPAWAMPVFAPRER
ncbi:serine/threonine-protein kinase [Streptantibioticus rubrisoli]|uniref:non-specific serine/threonine protein kinase n=1 Tax=Streptantibioticus rubrisoli TaxID=1387313 RepID=A0ABT1PCR3_9ACTN|nr:serine/threonine-protein kinase [Streptantibioticus rubrisoli]MCQ4043150.1 serine/threonine protein kinase [Streptantibioticus rubrisoli]